MARIIMELVPDGPQEQAIAEIGPEFRSALIRGLLCALVELGALEPAQVQDYAGGPA